MQQTAPITAKRERTIAPTIQPVNAHSTQSITKRVGRLLPSVHQAGRTA